MSLLLDTHVLLWWLEDEPSLSQEARDAIVEEDTFVSAASIWEIAIKERSRKLQVPSNFLEYVAREGFQALSITFEHAHAAGGLPPHHSDPFDRMLVAQALSEDLTIVTRDPRIAFYGVATLRA